MTWRIEFAPGARKALKHLDPVVVRRILTFLSERIAPAEDPRAIGMALRGADLGELWKYRVGDYRIICAIEDAEVKVLGVRIATRREVYR